MVAGPQERQHVVGGARLAVQHPLREHAGPGDPGRVLEDVEALHEVRVLGPGDPDALARALDLAAVALGEQVGDDLDQGARGHRLAALDAVVQLELEPRQRRHHEEVAIEVRHRLVDDGDGQLGLGVLGQQVGPHQRLVQVRGDLGHERRVAGVHVRLGVPGEPRVHRVAELVGQDARAAQVLGVVQADERLGQGRAGRERPRPLAAGRVDVDPALLERAAAQRLRVLRRRAGRPPRRPSRAPARTGSGSRRGSAAAAGRRARARRGRAPAGAPASSGARSGGSAGTPRRRCGRPRRGSRSGRSWPRGPSRSGGPGPTKTFCLATVTQGVRQRRPDAEVAVGVALPGRASQLAVGPGHQRLERRPRRPPPRRPVGAGRRHEGELGVGQQLTRDARRDERLAHLRQQVLDLGGAQVRGTPARRGRSSGRSARAAAPRPAASARRCAPRATSSGSAKATAASHPGGQGDRALLAAGGVLARGVGGELERRMRPHALDGRPGCGHAVLEELEQHGSRLAEPSAVAAQGLEVALDPGKRRLPVRRALEDALEIPGARLVHVVPAGSHARHDRHRPPVPSCPERQSRPLQGDPSRRRYEPACACASGSWLACAAIAALLAVPAERARRARRPVEPAGRADAHEPEAVAHLVRAVEHRHRRHGLQRLPRGRRSSTPRRSRAWRYTDTALATPGAYTYTVTAIDSDGEGPPSTAVTVTFDNVAPAAPTGLTGDDADALEARR